MSHPKYITLEKAMEITGRSTKRALTRFVENWNYRNLDDMILRIPGRVDEHSLRRALDKLAQKHTPGMEVRRTVAQGRTGNRR